MLNEKEEILHNVGEMKKDRVMMEDGRRYLIFYTFEKPPKPPVENAVENAPESEGNEDV